MAGNSSLQEKLKQGIEAARRGDKVSAQRLLRQVVDSDRNNEVAWMWLASTLDNLQERHNALEEALRINPKNARAQEAIQQLESVMPQTRRPSQSNRPTTGSLPRINTGNVGGNTIIIIGAAILGLVILGVIIFGIVSNSQQNNVPNAATVAARQAAALYTAVPTATIDPDTYTATPFYGVIVTRENQQSFPPTFTPTATDLPSATPAPTETPFPLARFNMLYTSLNEGDAQPALYKAAGDGTGDQQMGAATEGFSDIAYSPDGKLIAFVRTITYDKDGKSVTSPELFVAPVDNTAGAQQITQFGTTHLATPAWASDSIQLLFVSNFDGDDEIWYITEDGKNLRQVTQSDGVDKDPVWSPDNNTIVFASERANFVPDGTNKGLTQLFSMTADGATTTQLTDAAPSSYTPAFSPDGTRIVFASDRDGKGNIYVMDPNGENLSRLTLDPNSENRQPAFTPNGRTIVFLSNAGGDNFQLYAMDANGQNVTRLSDPGRNIQSFAFLPLPLALFNP